MKKKSEKAIHNEAYALYNEIITTVTNVIANYSDLDESTEPEKQMTRDEFYAMICRALVNLLQDNLPYCSYKDRLTKYYMDKGQF